MLKKLKYFYYSLIGTTFLLVNACHSMEPYLICEYNKDDLKIRSITAEAYCTRENYPDHFAVCDLTLPIREVALDLNNGKQVTITTQDIYDALDTMENAFTDPNITNNAFVNPKTLPFPFDVNEDKILFVKVEAYNTGGTERECTIKMYESNSYQRINLYFESVNGNSNLTFNKLN